jgi:hypothetical protein
MTFPLSTMTLRVLSTLLCTTSLVACGGGGGGSANADSVQAGLVVAKGDTASTAAATSPFTPAVTTPVASTSPVVAAPVTETQAPVIAPTDTKTGIGGVVVTPVSPTVPVVPPVTVPVAAPAVPASGTLAVVTDVRLQNTSAVAQTSVPVTFGQVFVAGHVKPTDAMVGRMEDNSLVTLQMDVKARHADGSVRHAIFSAIIPSLAANATRTMSLAKNTTSNAATATLPAELLATGFTASTSATIAGVKYSASADQLLKAGAKATWLAGAVANEWHVSAPLTTASGVAHPHLTARFAVRYYTSVKKARVDVTIENNWAYEPNPQNFKYDTEVLVGGQPVYKKAALDHVSQARWRKTFWYGGDASQVNVQLNTAYLIATRAVPNYDQSVNVSEATLSAIGSNYAKSNIEPMGVALAMSYMPTTGGRDDIGLLPMWGASYLLTMDQRARTATLGTADLSGSWGTHYRDRKTDRPISLTDFPYMTLIGRASDTFNPVTKQFESFPNCASGASCASPHTPDTAHQASFVYLPYLVTGDYYYLEELQFWAMWNVFQDNPNYRGFGQGLLAPGQVRGQAWSMRTLAEAAYITPDSDVLKPQLLTFVDNNLNWYNNTYVTGAGNNLGVITNGYAMSYSNGTALAPWQDDFFTAAIGHVAELGFNKAGALLAWKSKFPVARMTDAAGCWLDGAVYNMVIQDLAAGPVYKTYAQAWKATHTADFNALACNSPAMAKLLGVKVGEMTGYSDSVAGYPSNMQPALAYAVDSGIANAKAAWTVFQSRVVKPDYSKGPQFAIVPR